MPAFKVSVPIDRIALGVVCGEPVVDESGVLLIAANTRITQRLINGLRDRGIESLDVNPRELYRLKNGRRKPHLPLRHTRSKDEPWLPLRPLKNFLVDRFDDGIDAQRNRVLHQMMGNAKQSYESASRELRARTLRTVRSLTDAIQDYGNALIDDHDQTVGMLNLFMTGTLISDRSIRLAALGMSVAIEMGLDGPKTLEVGMTGILHDIGLALMDPQPSMANHRMDAHQLWEYRKHPLIAAQCLAELQGVPPNVHLAVQQVHEQYDGSGFPRGISGNRIHHYARILNVVDVYLQLTRGDGGLSPIIPHDAMGFLLHQMARGIFEPSVVKAFLRCKTLFPLGSHVELSDGNQAQVIRRPKAGYDSPVLLTDTGKRLDLKHSKQQIVRPLADPQSGQTRMQRQAMRETAWNADSAERLRVG